MKDIKTLIESMPVECPECGQLSDSIKCFKVPNYLLFLFFYAAYEYKKVICCPHCMRKHILIKYFSYNILIGNVLWLVMGLPAGIWKFCSTFTKGHSKTVKEFLSEKISDTNQPKQKPIEI